MWPIGLQVCGCRCMDVCVLLWTVSSALAPVCQRITAAEWRREKNNTPQPSRNFFFFFFFCVCVLFCSPCNKRRSSTSAPLDIWSEVMEVAPAFWFLLCVSLRVSLAADWEFVDTNFTHFGDVIDYKDPCKAGTVNLTSSMNLMIFCISSLCRPIYNGFSANIHSPPMPWSLWAGLIKRLKPL